MKVKLEEVCERGSSNLKQSDIVHKSGQYPIYGASGCIGHVDFYHQEKKYVAVVKDGAGIGRTMLLPAKSSIIGTMQYLLPKKNVLPEYLYYVVRHMHLEKYFSGATIPHIYFRDYRNEEFNLDCLEKQTDIVETLGKVEKIIASRQQQLQKLDELVKARFIELFGTVENNVFNFDVKTIGEVATLKSGTSLPSEIENEGGNVPYIKVGDMNYSGNEYYITTSSRYVTEKTAGKGIFEIGTVIFPKRGGAIGTNKKRLTTLPICADLNVMGVTPNKSHILPSYLMAYFDLVDLGSLDNGSSVPQINNKDIAPLRICIPPIDLQNEFAKFVEETDKLKLSVQQALDKAQLLFDSLMQKYFGYR